jgi:hypothetical protein
MDWEKLPSPEAEAKTQEMRATAHQETSTGPKTGEHREDRPQVTCQRFGRRKYEQADQEQAGKYLIQLLISCATNTDASILLDSRR